MKKIALIEDDEDIAFTLRLNLEREGYAVSHFGRGQEGLQAVQRGAADFVILDQDIMQVPEQLILRTGVIATYIGGKAVYQRP